MTIEFSVFAVTQLEPLFNELKRAVSDLENAKRRQDSDARKQAERHIHEIAHKCIEIEPTIAYLWPKACDLEFESYIREAWQLPVPDTLLLEELALKTSVPDLTTFPPGSWAVQFTFTLRKPYISKDDTEFYILDNPMKKEWVFKVPYVAPSQWKGALRAAMIQDLVDTFVSAEINENTFVRKRLQLYRLFGNEKDGTAEFLNRIWARHRVGSQPENENHQKEWENRFRRVLAEVAGEFERELRNEGYRDGNIEGFQGRLHFYPTYFDSIGLEVINPHNRETGAGKLPIYFECVPQGAKGTFTLVYVPLGVKDEEQAKREAKEDLQAVAAGLQAMMTKYGFGAKTSSGFGVAEYNEGLSSEEKLVIIADERAPKYIIYNSLAELCKVVQNSQL